jgi:hypothetical protein
LNFYREPGLSTRQRNHFFKKIILKIVFAEWCQLALGQIDLFAECQGSALGKETIFLKKIFLKIVFAEWC